MTHEDDIVRLLLHHGRSDDECHLEGKVGRQLTLALRSTDEAHRQAAYGHLAALTLRCPSAITAEHWTALLDGVDGDGPHFEVVRLFEGLLACAEYPPGAERLGHRLTRLRCAPELLLDLAALVAGWQAKELRSADLLAIASRDLDARQAGRFFSEVLERWCWRGEVGASDWMDALSDQVGSYPRWCFTRDLLKRCQPGRVRQQEPPRKEAPRSSERFLPARILVVQNLDIGQGDEIVRCGTLVALLLARQPEARVDLVTRRAHLYDHPRVRVHPIDDTPAIQALLDESFEGLVWLDEIHAPEIRRHAWIPAALATKADADNVDLILEAATHRNHLDFRQVVVDGADLRPTLNVARCTPDLFEQLQLLALALGLPWYQEGCSTFAAPFVGVPSKAARSWLRRQRQRPQQRQKQQQPQQPSNQRPLAVVQPFGGAAEIKGYVREQVAELATALDDLVAEGLDVILLPTASPWGAPSHVSRLLESVQPQTRLSVMVAPNTASDLSSTEERSELDLADRTIRLFKYLIAEADLVVAVEGWVAHLAALLGKPVRLVLCAGSYGPDWYPQGCEWADGLSPCGCTRDEDKPPVPALDRVPLSRPRRQLLAVALDSLRQPSKPAASILRSALHNPDPTLRSHAAKAAASQLDDPELGDEIRSALQDPSASVRAAAAQALLQRPELRHPTDPPPETLEAHRAIQLLRWPKVVLLGDAALAALAIASSGEPSFTRREARRVLHRMLSHRAGGRQSAPSESSP